MAFNPLTDHIVITGGGCTPPDRFAQSYPSNIDVLKNIPIDARHAKGYYTYGKKLNWNGSNDYHCPGSDFLCSYKQANEILEGHIIYPLMVSAEHKLTDFVYRVEKGLEGVVFDISLFGPDGTKLVDLVTDVDASVENPCLVPVALSELDYPTDVDADSGLPLAQYIDNGVYSSGHIFIGMTLKTLPATADLCDLVTHFSIKVGSYDHGLN